jgi:hypothetical protein
MPRSSSVSKSVRANHGIEIQIELSATDADRLAERSRTLVSRTGCGLCGVETIRDALRMPEPIPHTLDISRDALYLAVHELGKKQPLNNETNTVHAAAWANQFGELMVVREDVGRHNALDKVLGRARSRVDADQGRLHRRHESRELRDGAEGSDLRRRARRGSLAADRSRRSLCAVCRRHARGAAPRANRQRLYESQPYYLT